jgi:hypothetical protein
VDDRLLTDGATSDRYDGRPFLRLLECYVLRAVGQLSPAHAARLDELTPKLQATYGLAVEWPQIVEHEMEFPPEMPAELRSMWERKLAAAADAGVDVDPESWTRQVVDKNFV